MGRVSPWSLVITGSKERGGNGHFEGRAPQLHYKEGLSCRRLPASPFYSWQAAAVVGLPVGLQALMGKASAS